MRIHAPSSYLPIITFSNLPISKSNIVQSESLNPTYEDIYNEDLGKYATGIIPFETTREQASSILNNTIIQYDNNMVVQKRVM